MVRVRSSLGLLIAPVVMVALVGCGPAPGGSANPGASAAAAGTGAVVPSADGGSTDPGGSNGTAGDAVWLPEWADETVVPAAVTQRSPVRFCGLEKAPAPAPGEFIDAIVRKCFWDVWQAGGAAEFASVQSSMEGDPVAMVYRLPGDGTVEVWTDGSQDRFGSGGWTLTRCRGLVEDTEGQAFFGTADCDEGVRLD